MKHKIAFSIGILLILTIIITGIYLYQKNQTNNFLYKSGPIPQDKLISTDNYGSVDNAQIKGGMCTGTDCVYTCKDTGKLAKKIKFYEISAGPKIEGGWSHRYAYICGQNYWIFDAADSFGAKVYGPFPK